MFALTLALIGSRTIHPFCLCMKRFAEWILRPNTSNFPLYCETLRSVKSTNLFKYSKIFPITELLSQSRFPSRSYTNVKFSVHIWKYSHMMKVNVGKCKRYISPVLARAHVMQRDPVDGYRCCPAPSKINFGRTEARRDKNTFREYTDYEKKSLIYPKKRFVQSRKIWLLQSESACLYFNLLGQHYALCNDIHKTRLTWLMVWNNTRNKNTPSVIPFMWSKDAGSSEIMFSVRP